MVALKLRKPSIMLVLILVIVMSLSNPSRVQGSSDFVLAAERITLTIDFGNGTIREYNDLNGSTVLEVTSSVLDVDIQWFGTLAYIRGIEGFVGEGEYGWQFWVNGEFASVAVNLYTLEDNDTIEWVYSTPNPQPVQDPTLIPGASIILISGIGFLAIVYVQSSRRLK
ncbi:MAG: DUF4430 domain-containing protein [Candidatus Odinarchaeota archaeon]